MIINYNCPHRKSLYQSVFEYDTPLMHPAPCQFEFVAADECDADNPWKESFRQLYYGIHVRPNHRPKKDSRIKHFNTIRVSFVLTFLLLFLVLFSHFCCFVSRCRNGHYFSLVFTWFMWPNL